MERAIAAVVILCFFLPTMAVKNQPCQFPIEGLPTVTEFKFLPWARHPQPMARVTFSTRYPVIHHYWTVSHGRDDMWTDPDYPEYPLKGIVSGVYSYSQESGPGETQHLLYSTRALGNVKVHLVLDIGCNVVLTEVNFKKPFNRELSGPKATWKMLKLPPRENVVQEGDWKSWHVEMSTTEDVTDHSEVVIELGRNGTRLLQDLWRTGQKVVGKRNGLDLSSGEIRMNVKGDLKLKEGVNDVVAVARAQIGYGPREPIAIEFRFPFSYRTSQLTKPTIYFTLRGYTLEEDDDEYAGKRNAQIKRRSDTPNSFKVHINANPFPDYQIKDLKTGRIFPNLPYKMTETYQEELILTPPIPNGEKRTYEITATNSEGSETKQITFVGYDEAVLTVHPQFAYVYEQNFVNIKCRGYGKFQTLGLYESTGDDSRRPEKWITVREIKSENDFAQVDLEYRNQTVLFDSNLRVFCALDRATIEDKDYSDERKQEIYTRTFSNDNRWLEYVD